MILFQNLPSLFCNMTYIIYHKVYFVQDDLFVCDSFCITTISKTEIISL